MTEIIVRKICRTRLEMYDEKAGESVARILFPASGDCGEFVSLVFDPECNELQIEIDFTAEDGSKAGSLKTYITTDYLVAAMLHVASPPIVKHMIKEG